MRAEGSARAAHCESPDTFDGLTADAVVFLASHQARWITGQVLQVAGGHAL